MNYWITFFIFTAGNALVYSATGYYNLGAHGEYYYYGLVYAEILKGCLLYKFEVGFLTKPLLVFAFIQMLMHMSAVVNLYVSDYFLSIEEYKIADYLEHLIIARYEPLLLMFFGCQCLLILAWILVYDDKPYTNSIDPN